MSLKSNRLPPRVIQSLPTRPLQKTVVAQKKIEFSFSPLRSVSLYLKCTVALLVAQALECQSVKFFESRINKQRRSGVHAAVPFPYFLNGLAVINPGWGAAARRLQQRQQKPGISYGMNGL